MSQPDLQTCLERKPKKRAKKQALKRKRISPVSKRRAAELREYRKLREKFLLENPVCAVWLYFAKKADAIMKAIGVSDGKKRPLMSEEIHHLRGRTGARLNDTKYWLAVSRWGHDYIHKNAKWAYENGFLLPR